jgi:hypothetical protein
MSAALSLFPQHIPIGQDASGKKIYASMEFGRAMADLFGRVGGSYGSSNEDLATDAASVSEAGALAAQVAALARQVEELQAALDVVRRPAVSQSDIDALQLDLAIVPSYSAMLAQLGTMAKQNANAVAITGGTINGTSIGATAQSTGRFTTVGVGTTSPAYRFGVSNNGAQGLEFDSDGAAFGAGSTGILAYDRVAAGYVALTVAASSITLRATNTPRIVANGTGIGFFGATPVAKPTVTGSRGGNAALASALTALASEGLITDSTTA